MWKLLFFALCPLFGTAANFSGPEIVDRPPVESSETSSSSESESERASLSESEPDDEPLFLHTTVVPEVPSSGDDLAEASAASPVGVSGGEPSVDAPRDDERVSSSESESDPGPRRPSGDEMAQGSAAPPAVSGAEQPAGMDAPRKKSAGMEPHPGPGTEHGPPAPRSEGERKGSKPSAARGEENRAGSTWGFLRCRGCGRRATPY